ncbi:low temperature requirement protein A [Micromonospora sp. NPDC050686]|uniref:low temperature requirement protein A n=1 Tax=Micromonospora sp. NPDC050686 TaxID=3154631 RepID=UPI00340B2409
MSALYRRQHLVRETAESAHRRKWSGEHGRVGRTSESAQARDILRGEEESRQANFLELFFDLVLVFALIGVVSRVVPDLLSDDVRLRWLSLLYTVVLALPLLWLWTTTAYITSRFSSRCGRIQVMVLVSAFGLLTMSTSLPYAFVTHGGTFAVPYVLLQVGRPLLLLPLLREHKAIRALYTRLAIGFTASGVVWLTGAVVYGPYRVALWSVAITMDLVVARFNWTIPGKGRRPTSAWAMTSTRHLPERYLGGVRSIARGKARVSLRRCPAYAGDGCGGYRRRTGGAVQRVPPALLRS